MAPGRLFEFGDFRLNPTERLLFRSDKHVPLPPKAVDMLLLLVERRDHIVDKDTLLKEIWPDTFVEEGNLAQNISILRKILTEGRDGKELIETIPKRGYRFIAEVKETPAAPPQVLPPVRPEDTPRAELPSAVKTAPRTSIFVRSLSGVAAVLLLAGLAVLYLRPSSARPADLAERKLMLAVLPFENLSGDSAQEFFSDGLTEEMITQLGQMYAKHLGVIARTSAMQYKHPQKDVAQIGRELRVDYILEGSVRRAGEHVRISAQLIQVRDQTHLWAHSYERDLQDIISVQATVARDVAAEIKIRLLPEEQARLVRAEPVNPESYEAYLRGRHYFNSAASEQDLQNSIDEFERAIASDARNAHAYAGLADSYAALSDYYKPPREVLPKAKIAAQKALELDPDLSEAHAALGWVTFAYDWNWSLAEQEMRRAIALNPGNALAHDEYANYLAASGRHTEALAESQQALALDPFSVFLNANRGWYLILARQFDAAVEQERKALDLDPNSGTCRAYLAMAYAAQRRFREAIAEARRASSARLSSMDLAGMAGVFATSGARPDAEDLLKKLKIMMKHRYICPYETATIYVGLGKKKEAFQSLEKGYESHENCMVYLKTDPAFDALRPDPQFSDLLRRVGFPR